MTTSFLCALFATSALKIFSARKNSSRDGDLSFTAALAQSNKIAADKLLRGCLFYFFYFYSTWTPSFPLLLESNPLNGDTFHSVTPSVAVSDEEEEPSFSFSWHVNSAGAACSHLNSAAITRLATPALSRLAGLTDDSRYSGCNRGVKDRITRPR